MKWEIRKRSAMPDLLKITAASLKKWDKPAVSTAKIASAVHLHVKKKSK